MARQRLITKMRMKRNLQTSWQTVLSIVTPLLLALTAMAAPLHWDSEKEALDADLRNAPLIPTLEDLAIQTGWHIFLEPTAGKAFTTTFTGLPKGQAMRILLGDLNYSFIPQADGPTKLFIFRTTLDAATFEIQPKATSIAPATKRVPNQLIVKLKPGMKIEDLARQLGARVKGRIGSLNAYLLEFDNNDALEAARVALASNEDVESTDYNYYVDAPPAPLRLDGTSVSPVQLALNPPPADGRVVVGLIDTSLQSLSPDLQKFLLQQISVAGDAATSSEPTHGTSMAETILRAIQTATAGQSSVQILPVDVYGANAYANTFDVAKGIIQAVNGGATIINLSLGSTSDSTFLHGVITDVTGQQIPVFGAAGNQPVATPFYPAAYPEVIAVTASSGQGKLANYANYGNFVDMMAPGNSVVYLNGQAWLITGTSAASAYAAGLTAGFADARSTTPLNASQTVVSILPFNSSATGK
jgi:hypothetical protein